MSKADKIFEELGYTKNNNPQSYYKRINPYTIKYIDFDEDKTINVYCFDELEGIYSCTDISIQELQAINKKTKELGWNEQV